MPFPAKKIRLYIDCDGVILNTIQVAKRIAKKLGYDVDSYDGLHKFFLKEANWQILISECEILADAVNQIKALQATGKYKITILTKFSEEVFGKFTEILVPKSNVVSNEENDAQGEKDEYIFQGEGIEFPKEGIEKTQTEFHKLYFLKLLFPDIPIIAVNFKCKKEDIVDPTDAIIIEDSIGNFRGWSKKGIGVLFAPGGIKQFVYENRNDKGITEEESECVISNISEVENVPKVQELQKLLSKKLYIGRKKINR